MAQLLNPIADITTNSWITQAGATTNLYQAVDEDVASDADYVASPVGSSSHYELDLETGTDPVSSSGHVVRYRYGKAGSAACNLTVSLRQGATQIASWAHTGISAGWTTVGQTLSGGEADAITDYSDLRLRFAPVASTGTPAKVQDVGSAQNTTGAGTTVVTLAGGISTTVGNMAILRVAADNSGAGGARPGLTVADSKSNTWTVIQGGLADPGAASAGTCVYLAYAPITTSLVAADTITLTWGATTTAKAVVVEEWEDVDDVLPVATTAVANQANASSAMTVGPIAPTAANQLVYAALATEGPTGDTAPNDTDTTNGTWSTLTRLSTGSGTATDNQTIAGQYKVVSTTGNQTWNATITARDWAAVVVVFREGGSRARVSWAQLEAPEVANPKMESLVEDFEDALSSTTWPVQGTHAISGGRIQFQSTTGFPHIHTDTGRYDLIDSELFIRVWPGPTTNQPRVELSQDATFGTQYFMARKSDGNLAMGWRGSGVQEWTTAYNATDHAWWRMRADATTAYWDTSPDGSTWTNRQSATFATIGWTPTALHVWVGAGWETTDPGSYLNEFDNLNVAPAGGTVTGAGSANLVLTATATGSRTVFGAGGAALTLTATAAGRRTVLGAGSANLVLTATAQGATSGTVTGSGTANLTLTAAAVGRRTTFGSGTANLLLTATASGVVLSPGGLPFTEPFTGTNGDPWADPPWTTTVSSGGTVDIQSNQGRMLCGSGGGYNDWCRALLDDLGEADFTVSVDLVVGAQEEKYPALSFRTDRTWDPNHPVWPDNGYVIEVQVDDDTGGYWAVFRQDASEGTSLGAQDPYTITTGDTLHLEAIAEGSAVEVRVWRNAESRPSSPSFSFTDSSHTTRTGHQLGLNGGPTTTDSVVWDNFAVAPVTAPTITGSGAANLVLTATAAGVPTTFGAGVANLVLTATATVLGAGAVLYSDGTPLLYSDGTPVYYEDVANDVTGAGTAALVLTATAAGVPTTFGAGLVALTLTATGQGRRTVSGAGTADLALTATATGRRSTAGSGTATLTLAATAAGLRVVTGVGAASLALTATAQGRRATSGSGTATLTLTATAAGVPTTFGAGVANLVLTATASGVATGAGVGVGVANLVLTATASGQRTTFGQGVATLALTATAVGTPTTFGAGVAAFTLTAAAIGLRVVAGQAVANLVLTATATGRRSTSGSGTAVLVLTATSTGQRTTFGSGTATLVLTATAQGSAFGEGVGIGSAALVLTATAVGQRTVVGSGAAPLQLTAGADGQRVVVGQAAAVLVLVAAATGRRTVFGQAVAALVLTARAIVDPIPPLDATRTTTARWTAYSATLLVRWSTASAGLEAEATVRDRELTGSWT
jgi:hypothetical protein